MVTAANKIDSNATVLYYAEETSIGVLPGTPEWIQLEPNEYNDFGGEVTLVARNPINNSRQRKKGVITDLDASGGFNTDLTQVNLQDILQGFFFANLEPKGEEVPTAATATLDLFDVASTTGFQVGDLIMSTGFTDAGNNVTAEPITAIVVDTTIAVVGATLVTDAAPGTGVKIVNIGHEAASADINVSVAGALPAYTSTTLDFTTLGLVPGEWIFVGGDLALNQFVNAANNGFKRIKSIAAGVLTIDKSDSTMVVETGTALEIHFYLGRMLRNRTAANIVRRTYNLERQLGASDTDLPNSIQSEYLVGSLPNELTFNVEQADKITMDLAFISKDHEQRTGVTGIKSGNRTAVVEADAFNTTSDFSRINLSVLSATDEAPTALFAYVTDMTLSINNNASPNKAVSVLGAFDVTAGTFAVSGEMTAYFSGVTAVASVRNNDNVTLDMAIVKNNAGLCIDLPLLALGDGRLNVEQDAAITLPLSMEAATGAGFDTNMDHTLLMVFFDYLPDAADV